MTYEKIFSEVKKNFKKAKKNGFTEDFAFQFNITGEGEGIFYAAYKDGALSVEPYDYKDRDVIFEADGKTLIAIASGKLEPIDAIKSGKLSVDGNHELAKQLLFLTSGSVEKKSDADSKKGVKPAAKAAPKSASKTEAKPAAKAAATPAAKAEVKTEAKPASKTESKTEAKAEVKPAAKPEPKAETKPAAKAEAKPVIKTEAKPAAKSEAKKAAKPAAKTAKK